jgi:hypothetical protein
MSDPLAGYRTEPPNEIDWMGTENANDEPSLLFQQRRGRCYELAGFAVAFGAAGPHSRLIHGSWVGPVPKERIGHAWVRLPDGRIWEPIRARIYASSDFYEWTKAWDEVEYTAMVARRLILANDSFGRWHESRYP